MATVVIMPGGFHPFHAGHLALYQSAQRAFPNAEVFVAATNDTAARPFPFSVKEKLAKLAGVEPGHFVQVKSPFRAEEITAKFDPQSDNLIFVRSEKDANKPPQAGGVKKDGSASYLQPLLGAKKLEPFAQHAYMAYLPTVEFSGGLTSASEIRAEWPTLDNQGKIDRVVSLYPRTQGNAKLAATVVKLLDAAIGSTSDVAEGLEYADKLSGLVDLPVFNSATNPNPSGVAKVVNTGDRIMVVMNVSGVNVPYYISTGSGGKASVPTGKWYPVFGVHSSGWLNKGGEDSINKFYGSKMLALNANRLNNALGDLSSVEAQIPFMKKTGIAIINKDLQPMGHSEVSANPDEFKKRVNAFLAKLGSEPFYKVNATPQQGVAEASLEDRLKKYVRPVVKTIPKIERTTNPAGRTTDHVEWKVTGPMGDVNRFSSKKAAQAHYDSFSKPGPGSLNEFAPSDGDDGDNPLDDYPCYDCGSTIYMHHTRLCDLAEPDAIRDLPAEPGTQYWTGRVPKGLTPIPGLGKSIEESVEFMSDAQFYGEILSVLAALGAGLATGAYLKAKDIVKMYNANQIMRALEGHRVSNISDSERRALTKLLAEFKQAMVNRQGEDALTIANRIKSIATDQSGVAETVSANGTIANTSGAGAGMTASYQRRDNQPIDEDYLDERRL